MELIYIAFMLLVVGSPTWVYFDASSNKIGNAGIWAIATLFFWIVVFPAYLIKRKSLLEEAKSNPVEPRGRQIKLGVLAVLGIAIFIGILANIGFGFGYEIEEIKDAMNGNKLKVTRQEITSDSNFVSDIALVCELKGKNISLEVTSFYPLGKDKKLNPAPIRSVKAGGQLMIDVPIGKVKFGELEPIPFEHLVGTIDSQEYNNHFSWNISQERLLSTLAGLAKLGMASEHKNSPSELAPEEQAIFDKLASEEASIKDDEEYIVQLQSQQAHNKTLDDEGSNAMKEELAEKTSQLIERKKALEGLKASAAAVEQKMATLKAADQADAAKLSELNKKTEDVMS